MKTLLLSRWRRVKDYDHYGGAFVLGWVRDEIAITPHGTLIHKEHRRKPLVRRLGFCRKTMYRRTMDTHSAAVSKEIAINVAIEAGIDVEKVDAKLTNPET